ncbi:sulfotransferase [Actinospongicola halichondriae]|uniref:sulfotransferase n=1 Tax=Actinospongicola halichondriae TaxID=3236844 RepID=UPI003D4AD362
MRVRTERAPALIIGSARSGTSFIGATLGAAPRAAYQREPLTHEIFRRRLDLVPQLADPTPSDALTALADRAFSGRPAVSTAVTPWPSQFWSRTAETLVIKEVLPMSALWLTERFAATALFVLRHPAAIVSSWHRRNWIRAPHESAFGPFLDEAGIRDDPAACLGAILARHEQSMVAAAAAVGPRAKVIEYEELARRPVRVFQASAAHLGLAWNDAMEAEVAAATDGTLERSDGRQHLVRDSRRRSQAWRDELSASTICSIRQGYATAGGGIYSEAW